MCWVSEFIDKIEGINIWKIRLYKKEEWMGMIEWEIEVILYVFYDNIVIIDEKGFVLWVS